MSGVWIVLSGWAWPWLAAALFPWMVKICGVDVRADWLLPVFRLVTLQVGAAWMTIGLVMLLTDLFPRVDAYLLERRAVGVAEERPSPSEEPTSPRF